MKIKTDNLIIFLNKVSLNKNILNGVLNFTNEGLITQLNSNNICMTVGNLNSNAFIEYAAIGEIAVPSLKKLILMLEQYSDKTIELKLEDSKLKIISDTGMSYLSLCDKEFADCYSEKIPELNYSNSISVPVSIFKSIIKANSIINNDSIAIIETKNEITLMTENESGDKVVEKININNGIDSKSKFGDALFNVISVISDSIKVEIANDFPIRLTEESKYYNIIYIVAPRVEND